MDYLLILFVAVPYLAIAIFILGMAYRISRWLAPKATTGLYNVSIVPNTFSARDVLKDELKRVFAFYTLPKMEDDRTLIIGSLLFHYGLAVLLTFHLNVVTPFLPLPSVVSSYLGNVAGVIPLAGLLILTFRRIGDSRIYVISYLDDFVAIALLLALISLGLFQTFYVDVCDLCVQSWLTSILSLRPEVASMNAASLVTMTHILLAMLFLAYIPFGKMVHVISYLFMPTIARHSHPVVVQGSSAPEEEVRSARVRFRRGHG